MPQSSVVLLLHALPGAMTLRPSAHAGTLQADVLANTTSVGMAPAVSETPVPAAALAGYSLVFDAVYTPLDTRLLKVLIERHVRRHRRPAYPI